VAVGLRHSGAAVEQQRFYEVVGATLPARVMRHGPTWEQLRQHANELRELINRSKEPLKPKTPFLVIKSKYELEASYETFKRFARHQGLGRKEPRRMIRIELPPELETQLDYGLVGSLADPVSKEGPCRVGLLRGVGAFAAALVRRRIGMPSLPREGKRDPACVDGDPPPAHCSAT
jgi:hypothetical protein